MQQVSSGWAKGLRLSTPAGKGTRPTSGRVRTAMLNALQPYLEGAMFLDLFAGSGAMGIEAMSRGARGCVFVEHGASALHCLRRNIDELKRRQRIQSLEPPDIQLLSTDSKSALRRLHGRMSFDIIFLDPPYAETVPWVDLVASLAPELTIPGSLVMIESDARAAVAWPVVTGGVRWNPVREKTYGDTMIRIVERTDQ